MTLCNNGAFIGTRNNITANNGYVTLPGRLLLQWGTVSYTGATQYLQTINLPIALSAPPYSIQLTYNNVDMAAGTGTYTQNRVGPVSTYSTPTASSFQVLVKAETATNIQIFWQALGKL